MTARKPTKRELVAKRRAKEAAAKRDRREPLTPLDVWAIHVAEAYEALIRHGFTKEQAMEFITFLEAWGASNGIIFKNVAHTA